MRKERKKKLRAKLLRRHGDRCRYCGKTTTKETRSIDHVVPTSRGGRNNFGNLVIACKDCNNAKGDTLRFV